MNLFRQLRSAWAFHRRWKRCSDICFLCRHRGNVCNYQNPYIRWI